MSRTFGGVLSIKRLTTRSFCRQVQCPRGRLFRAFDLGGVFTLRTIPDSRAIRTWIQTTNAKKAVIVGGGFIGLEMAENLARRGLNVTIIEMFDQVMPPLDREMAEYVYVHLLDNHISVHLADAVARFNGSEGRVRSVETQSGARFQSDLVILSVGVKPETKLAKEAGLELGPRGGIRVDESMKTSDPCIWAVGDVVEVRDAVTAEFCLVPLAGPANRQARIAADAICGRPARFRGVQATAVCGVFGLTVATTGVSEKRLLQAKNTNYEAVYLHPSDHASYYPGAKAMHLKLIFRRSDGLVLGAQAVGEQGVERGIERHIIRHAKGRHSLRSRRSGIVLCAPVWHGQRSRERGRYGGGKRTEG